MTPRWIPPLAVALLCACASSSLTSRDPLARPPSNFDGFPSQTLQGIVFASARYIAEHDEIFGVDLFAKARVIPIAVTIRLRGPGQDEAQALLNPERMDPRLFLQDGTPLAALSAEAVVARVAPRHAANVRAHALQSGLLSPDGREAFLFFALEPRERFRFDGESVEREQDGATRELDLRASLLAFNVTIDGEPRPFYLGLQR